MDPNPQVMPYVADNHSQHGPAGPPMQANPLANYHFSPEEMRVLRECNTESFFQRSLPLGTSFGLAAYFAVKRGMLQPSAKFGAMPKVIVSVIVGYFMGKFSYQQKCAEKIMRIPNSQLGAMLRERKQRGGSFAGFTPDQGLSLAPFASAPESEYYSDQFKQAGSSLEMDTNVPYQKGLDDNNRPTLDTPITTFEDDLPKDPPKNSTTYDELRNRNREEYAKKTNSPYYRPLPESAPAVTRVPEPREEPEFQQAKGRKNKYGDEWTS